MRGELPSDQSRRNAENAIRALNMLPDDRTTKCVKSLIECGKYQEALSILSGHQPVPSSLVPHPHIVALAEIRNAIRYL